MPSRGPSPVLGIILATREQQGDGGRWIKTPLDLIDSNLSDGAFRLYLRLVAYRGARGCFPSQETLADNLHCSDRAIRRYLIELKNFGLIQWQRRWVDGRQISAYSFVDGTEVSGQKCPVTSASERTKMSGQSQERPDKIGKSEWPNLSRDLDIRRTRGLINPSINQSSCSSETGSHHESTDGKDRWTPSGSTLKELRKLIGSAGDVGLPTEDEARLIAGEFDSQADLDLWVEIRFPKIPHGKAKTIGLYRADSKQWMAQRRRDVAAGNADLYEPTTEPEPLPVDFLMPTPEELRQRSLRDLAQRRDRFPDTDERWNRWAEAERKGNVKAQIAMMTGRLFGYDAAVRMARAKFSARGDVLLVVGDIDETDLRDVLACLEGQPFTSFERSTGSLEAEAEPGSVPRLPEGAQAPPSRGRVLRMGERSA